MIFHKIEVDEKAKHGKRVIDEEKICYAGILFCLVYIAGRLGVDLAGVLFC